MRRRIGDPDGYAEWRYGHLYDSVAIEHNRHKRLDKHQRRHRHNIQRTDSNNGNDVLPCNVQLHGRWLQRSDFKYSHSSGNT